MEEIVIHHNDELGEPIWSISLSKDIDNWIDSFYQFSHAVEYAKEIQKDLRLNIKIKCSVTNCRIEHSLTHE